MEDAFYITTPIYYVNASPHIGHAYTTIVADVLARYHRLPRLPDLLHDRNGRARRQDRRGGREERTSRPQEYADRISAQFRNLWPELSVTNDYFIRTTDANHVGDGPADPPEGP